MAYSVLMSVYKRERPDYLRASIDSVMNQSLPPAQLVLVADGVLTDVLDHTISDLASSYPQIESVPLARNEQLGRALAEGMKHCRYDLVARMDTDDLVADDRFEKQYAYMKAHPECDVLGGWLDEFDEGQPDYHRTKRMPESMNEIREYAKYRNPVNHMTVMFRKKAVEKAGGYRHFPLLEDYDLWTRMLAGGAQFHNLPQVLVHMRVSRDLYARRGGYEYCSRYMELRRRQHELGLLTGLEYHKARILTMGMTLMPSWIRRIVYQRRLRQQD